MQDHVAEAVAVDAAQVRRSRRGKAAAFTKLLATAQSLIGCEKSKRLLGRYREKLETSFEEIKSLNNTLLNSTENDEEYESACAWLPPYEDKFECITCAISDELEARQDEPITCASSVSSYAAKAMTSLHVSDKDIPEEVPLNKIDEPVEEKPVFSPNKEKAFDDWIQNCDEPVTARFVTSEAAMSDALVGLQLKLKRFTGDPLDYHTFISSFRHQVHARDSLTACAKMAHLLSYVEGPAQLAIEGLGADERGYKEALKTLKELFGNKVTVSRAYIDRVAKGPVIGSKDPTKLRAFYHELFACWSALDRMQYFDDANSSSTLVEIVKRLPFRMQERWKHVVVKLRHQNKAPDLKAVVNFVKTESLAQTDAVWGDLGQSQDNRPTPRFKGDRAKVLATGTGGESSCVFCDDVHKSWTCKRELSWAERKECVAKSRACFNCLRPGHRVANCSSQRRCEKCNQAHHTLLHRDVQEKKKDTVETVAASSFACDGCYLQVVSVEVLGPKGSVRANALLDTGSQLTLLSKELATRVGLKGTQSSVAMTTVTNKRAPTKATLVSLKLKNDEEEVVNIPQAYVIKHLDLPCRKPDKKVIKNMSHLEGISLSHKDGDKIDMLIGANVSGALLPLECRRGDPEEPVAVRTIFGWCLLGGSSNNQGDNNVNVVSALMRSSSPDSLEGQLERLWKTEDFGTKYDFKRPFSQEDKRAEETLEKAALVDGHYQMGLLWKEPDCHLPNNRSQALSRLGSLERRFAKDPAYAELYKTEVKKYIDEGYAVRFHEQGSCVGNRRWYLPHHGVINVNKPGRVRVVFDAAARYSGTSLNDRLVSGPDLLNDLLGCILRFRQQPVAIMSDIKAMFNQVLVAEKDREALLFLWWEDGDTSKEAVAYQMKTHVFGLISSPCCAITALHRTAQDHREEFGEEIVDIVKRSFFMDDLLLSVRDDHEAVTLATKLIDVMQLGGFQLTKWISNSSEVLKAIPASERSPKVLDMDREGALEERALGIKWSVSEDAFVFNVNDLDKPATKRGILSLVSSVFNPDGILSPLLLIPKLLLRHLWTLGVGWDEPLPDEVLSKWHFNPPSSPHMGGVWERVVRSVKRAMKVVLRRQVVGQECFDTVLCDVEAVLNSRPLTGCSDDAMDMEPLTPFHFLLMKASPALPPGKFGAADVLLRKHWRRAQALVDQFWTRWRREYLVTLHPRSKWASPRPNVQIGDLILLCEDNMPRGHWPMGRVIDMHPGSDGLVRSVRIKTAHGELVRPVAKLCLLEGSSL